MPSAHPSPEQTTKVSKWNANKGYGWLQWQDKDLFLHVRDFNGNGRDPQIGEPVRLMVGEDSQGRRREKNVSPLRGTGPRLPARSALALMGLLILPVLAVYHQHLSAWGLGLYGAFVSLVTYATYASDKRRAETRDRRIPEIYLHFLELIGGWPAAWIAQRRLRHKSSKLGYQIKFWLIISVHQLLAVDSMLGWQFTRRLADSN